MTRASREPRIFERLAIHRQRERFKRGRLLIALKQLDPDQCIGAPGSSRWTSFRTHVRRTTPPRLGGAILVPLSLPMQVSMRWLRTSVLICTCFLVAALSIVTAAHTTLAQTLLNEDVAWPGLTQGDLDRMHAAAARLYEGVSIGTIERWRHPHSQNAGEIRLVRTFTARDMPCRTLEYTTRFNVDRTRLSHATINWCKVQQGEWKIVELIPPR
jgi:surface antigen